LFANGVATCGFNILMLRWLPCQCTVDMILAEDSCGRFCGMHK
jgi:hypothetical protein